MQILTQKKAQNAADTAGACKITYMVCINCITTCTADTTIGKGREKCRRWSACSHDIYLIIANDNQPSKYPVRPHHSSGIETLCAPITY